MYFKRVAIGLVFASFALTVSANHAANATTGTPRLLGFIIPGENGARPRLQLIPGAQRFLGEGQRIAAAPLSRLRQIGGNIVSGLPEQARASVRAVPFNPQSVVEAVRRVQPNDANDAQGSGGRSNIMFVRPAARSLNSSLLTPDVMRQLSSTIRRPPPDETGSAPITSITDTRSSSSSSSSSASSSSSRSVAARTRGGQSGAATSGGRGSISGAGTLGVDENARRPILRPIGSNGRFTNSTGAMAGAGAPGGMSGSRIVSSSGNTVGAPTGGSAGSNVRAASQIETLSDNSGTRGAASGMSGATESRTRAFGQTDRVSGHSGGENIVVMTGNDVGGQVLGAGAEIPRPRTRDELLSTIRTRANTVAQTTSPSAITARSSGADNIRSQSSVSSSSLSGSSQPSFSVQLSTGRPLDRPTTLAEQTRIETVPIVAAGTDALVVQPGVRLVPVLPDQPRLIADTPPVGGSLSAGSGIIDSVVRPTMDSVVAAGSVFGSDNMQDGPSIQVLDTLQDLGVTDRRPIVGTDIGVIRGGLDRTTVERQTIVTPEVLATDQRSTFVGSGTSSMNNNRVGTNTVTTNMNSLTTQRASSANLADIGFVDNSFGSANSGIITGNVNPNFDAGNSASTLNTDKNIDSSGQIGSVTDFGGANVDTSGGISRVTDFGGANFDTSGRTGRVTDFGGANVDSSGRSGSVTNFGGANVDTSRRIGSVTDFGGANVDTSGRIGSVADLGGANVDTSGRIGSVTNFGGANVDTSGRIGSVTDFGGANVDTSALTGRITDFGGANIDTSGPIGNVKDFRSSNVDTSGPIGRVTEIGGANIDASGRIGSVADVNVGNVEAGFGRTNIGRVSSSSNEGVRTMDSVRPAESFPPVNDVRREESASAEATGNTLIDNTFADPSSKRLAVPFDGSTQVLNGGRGISVPKTGQSPVFKTMAVENKLFDVNKLKEVSAQAAATAFTRQPVITNTQTNHVTNLGGSNIPAINNQFHLNTQHAQEAAPIDTRRISTQPIRANNINADIHFSDLPKDTNDVPSIQTEGSFVGFHSLGTSLPSVAPKSTNTKFLDQSSLLAMVTDQISKLQPSQAPFNGASPIGPANPSVSRELRPTSKGHMPFTGPASEWNKRPSRMDVIRPQVSNERIQNRVDLPPPPIDLQSAQSVNTTPVIVVMHNRPDAVFLTLPPVAQNSTSKAVKNDITKFPSTTLAPVTTAPKISVTEASSFFLDPFPTEPSVSISTFDPISETVNIGRLPDPTATSTKFEAMELSNISSGKITGSNTSAPVSSNTSSVNRQTANVTNTKDMSLMIEVGNSNIDALWDRFVSQSTTGGPMKELGIQVIDNKVNAGPLIQAIESKGPSGLLVTYDMTPFKTNENWAIFDPTSVDSTVNFIEFGPILDVPIDQQVAFTSNTDVNLAKSFTPPNVAEPVTIVRPVGPTVSSNKQPTSSNVPRPDVEQPKQGDRPKTPDSVPTRLNTENKATLTSEGTVGLIAVQRGMNSEAPIIGLDLISETTQPRDASLFASVVFDQQSVDLPPPPIF